MSVGNKWLILALTAEAESNMTLQRPCLLPLFSRHAERACYMVLSHTGVSMYNGQACETAVVVVVAPYALCICAAKTEAEVIYRSCWSIVVYVRDCLC